MNKHLSVNTEILPSRPISPDQRLMAAILEDAIRCLLNGRGATEGSPKSLDCRDAHAWIFSNRRENVLSAFDFDTVCDVLGLNADYVRDGIRNLIGGSGLRIKRHVKSIRGPIGRRRKKSAHRAFARVITSNEDFTFVT